MHEGCFVTQYSAGYKVNWEFEVCAFKMDDLNKRNKCSKAPSQSEQELTELKTNNTNIKLYCSDHTRN